MKATTLSGNSILDTSETKGFSNTNNIANNQHKVFQQENNHTILLQSRLINQTPHHLLKLGSVRKACRQCLCSSCVDLLGDFDLVKPPDDMDGFARRRVKSCEACVRCDINGFFHCIVAVRHTMHEALYNPRDALPTCRKTQFEDVISSGTVEHKEISTRVSEANSPLGRSIYFNVIAG